MPRQPLDKCNGTRLHYTEKGLIGRTTVSLLSIDTIYNVHVLQYLMGYMSIHNYAESGRYAVKEGPFKYVNEAGIECNSGLRVEWRHGTTNCTPVNGMVPGFKANILTLVSAVCPCTVCEGRIVVFTEPLKLVCVCSGVKKRKCDSADRFSHRMSAYFTIVGPSIDH